MGQFISKIKTKYRNRNRKLFTRLVDDYDIQISELENSQINENYQPTPITMSIIANDKTNNINKVDIVEYYSKMEKMVEYYKQKNELLKLELNDKLNEYSHDTKEEFNIMYEEIDKVKDIIKSLNSEQKKIKSIIEINRLQEPYYKDPYINNNNINTTSINGSIHDSSYNIPQYDTY